MKVGGGGLWLVLAHLSVATSTYFQSDPTQSFSINDRGTTPDEHHQPMIEGIDFDEPGIINVITRQKRNILEIADWHNKQKKSPIGIEPRKRRRKREKFKSPLYTTAPYSSLVIFSMGCTGFLISDQHVLTAAHCVHDGQQFRKGPKMKHLKVGLYNKKGRLYWIRVRKVIISEHLRPDKHVRLQFDYAVLKLARKHTNPILTLRAQPNPVQFVDVYPIQLDPRKTGHAPLSSCHVHHSTSYSFVLKRTDCPSQPGYSGSPVVTSPWTGDSRPVIGLLSARAMFRETTTSSFPTTLLKRFSPVDVARIKYWQTF